VCVIRFLLPIAVGSWIKTASAFPLLLGPRIHPGLRLYFFIFLHDHVSFVCRSVHFYCATQIWIARTCYGDVVGWVSVTRRYCIKTAKPIWNLFWPSGSATILVSSDPCAVYPIPRGTYSPGVRKTGMWGKLAIFDGNRRLSRKQCEIGR